MGNLGFTALSPALPGGDAMDEVEFDGQPAPAPIRKRPIVHLGHSGLHDVLLDPVNVEPGVDDYGLPVRVVGGSNPSPGALVANQATASSTAAALPANACSRVRLRALDSNGEPVWLGKDGSLTQSTGYPLMPGEAVDLVLSNTNLVWIFSVTGSPAVAFLAS